MIKKCLITAREIVEFVEITKKLPIHVRFIEYMPFDKNGNFWYPNIDGSHGNWFDSFELPDSIPLEDWTSFKIDNNWNIWLQAKNGQLYKFDMEDKSLNEENIFNFKYFKQGSIGIYEDNYGTLWIFHLFGVDKARKKVEYFENKAT